MKTCFLAFFILATSIHCANAQKASLHVRLLDSSAASPSDYIFELEIRNDSFPKYWVEDTATMRRDVLGHPLGLFNVIVTKYGKEGTYDSVKVHRGDAVPIIDSCLQNCCNCEILERKQAFRIKLPLVKNYLFAKGHYVIYVTLHPPVGVCDGCEQQEEINTDFHLWVR
jgi:hypothetical protein